MKYVHRITDSKGVLRLYFRKAGHPRSGAALAGPWPDVEAGSALEAEVAAILGTQIVRTRITNLAGAIHAYERRQDRLRGL